MDLQPLFTDPIQEQVSQHPGYEHHASHVWRVTTAREPVIVRTFRKEDLYHLMEIQARLPLAAWLAWPEYF